MVVEVERDNRIEQHGRSENPTPPMLQEMRDDMDLQIYLPSIIDASAELTLLSMKSTCSLPGPSGIGATNSVFATGYIAEYENSLEIASVLQDAEHTIRHKEATTNNENVPPSDAITWSRSNTLLLIENYK
ncbi:hypothetical protein FQA39_LY17066 [Lamprigera yunnana]|nr:hypothetical protein FQA39_LY17066 [Lamprigera yunnana]